ncbi:hotdog fold thioesterase [Timonella sp. A28]|uniref:hotdog fold thioesterase n=1 Tax=Timonella sp. A28 TaxID=3442640 RepID=UPI003EBE137F
METNNTLNAPEYSLQGTLIERMGIELTKVTAQVATGTMPVVGNTQPLGLLHGGASVVLAETLGSIAASVHAGEGRTAVGIEVSATHHASARSGHVYGTATALHLGKTTASYEIVITDESGRRLCTSRLTCMIIVRRD